MRVSLTTTMNRMSPYRPVFGSPDFDRREYYESGQQAIDEAIQERVLKASQEKLRLSTLKSTGTLVSSLVTTKGQPPVSKPQVLKALRVFFESLPTEFGDEVLHARTLKEALIERLSDVKK